MQELKTLHSYNDTGGTKMTAVKKRFYLGLCTTLIAGMLAACGNDNANEPAGTASQTATETGNASQQPEAKPVEITFWNFPTFQPLDGEVGKYEKQLIEAFNKKYPEIKVNLEMLTFEAGPEKLNVAIATNTAPDVIYDAPGRIIDWGKKGYLAPLNDMVTDEVKNDISQSFWNLSMVQDQVYMYPINTVPFTMAVNKTIFEKIGKLDLLPLDRPGRTWSTAEYEAALKAVKELAPADVIPSGFFAKSQAGDQGTRAYIANLGKTPFIKNDLSEITINSEEAGKALDWIVQAAKDKLVVDGSAALAANDVNDLFLQGKLATTLNYSAVLYAQNATLKKADFEEAMVSFPTPDGSAPVLEPYLGGMAVFNNNNPDKIAAAKKFVDFIANDSEWGVKNLKQTGGLSVRNSITGLYEGAEYKFSEEARAFIGTPPITADGYAELRTFWFPALQKALLGAAKGKEALDEFAKQANEAIAKARTAK